VVKLLIKVFLSVLHKHIVIWWLLLATLGRLEL